VVNGDRRSRMASRTPETLEKFVDGLIQDQVFKTRGAIAAACGMKDAAFSRAVSRGSGRAPKPTLSVEQCLRLAAAVEDDVAHILRVAGHAEVALIIVELYPPSTALTRREREHLKLWRQSTVSLRHHVEAILEFYVRVEGARTGGIHGIRNSTTVSSQRARKS
jgi:hypothetical protein